MPIGPFGGHVNQLTFSRTQRGVVYAAAQGGVYVSRDGGRTWAPVGVLTPRMPMNDAWNYGVENYSSVQEDPAAPGDLYVVKSDALLHYNASRNKWSVVYQGDYTSGFISMAVDPTDPRHIFISGTQVFLESRDGGQTFKNRWRTGGSSSMIQFSLSDPRMIELDEIFDVQRLSRDDGATWEQAIVGNKGMQGVAFAGADPNRLYGYRSGDFDTALYRSDDVGLTWHRLKTLPNLKPYSNVPIYAQGKGIYTDPHDPDVAYFVFEGFPQGDYKPIYKTVDGGVTWNPTAFKSDASIGGFVVDPFDSNHLLIIYGVNLIWGGTSLASSWNGGDDFTLTEQGLTVQDVRGVEVDPFSPATFYVLTENLYRTTDGGAHWDLFDPPDLIAPIGDNFLSLDHSGDGYLYTIDNFSLGGITQQYDITTGQWSFVPQMQGVAPVRIVPSDTTPGTLYVSTCLDLLYTVVSWDQGTDWSVTGADSCFYEDGFAPSTLTSGKVYRLGNNAISLSIDDGQTWTSKAMPTDIGPSLADLAPIAASVQSDSTVIMGARTGIATSTDDGGHWQRTYRCPVLSCGIRSIYADPSEIGKVYAGTDFGLLESDDDGQTWGPAKVSGLSQHLSNYLDHPTWAPSAFVVGTRDAGVFLRTDPTDVQVSITGTSGLVNLGDAFPYTITVTNAGAVDAAHVAVVLDSPSNAPMTLTDAGGGTCTDASLAGTRMVCDIPTLAAGAQWVLTTDVRMDFGDQAGFYAEATTAQGDMNMSNNSALSETESLEGTDLSVSIMRTAPARFIGTRGKLFTVTVKDKGIDTPVDMQIHYTSLVQGLIVAPSRRCTAIDHGFTCHINKLAAGQSATFDFAGSLPTAGYFTVAAFVKPVGMRDTRQVNDSDSATIVVR